MYCATFLSQFCKNPAQRYWITAKHALRYLKGTSDYGITYQKGKDEIRIFSDADWGANVADRKSFSGMIIQYAERAISWSCRKQPTVALSNTEAKYIALSESTRESLWLRNALSELGMEQFCEKSTNILTDNQGAIKLAEYQIASERTKHLILKYCFIRDTIGAKLTKIDYVPLESNLADRMTNIINGKNWSPTSNALW